MAPAAVHPPADPFDYETGKPINMERTGQNNHLPMVSSAISVWSLGVPIGSRQTLVRPSSKLSLFKSTSRKRLELFLAIAVLLGIILFSALCICIYFMSSAPNLEDDFCLTHQCLKTASNLMDSIDPNADPCENFYKYACGKWEKEHYISGSNTYHDWFMERSWRSERDVLDFIRKNNSEAEPVPVHQARGLYKSCLDLDSMAETGLERLWTLLNDIGLPMSPPISSKPKQPWIVSLAKARKLLSLDFLIGFGILNKPTNKTEYKLAIASAEDLLLPSRTLKYTQVDKKLKIALEKGEEDVIKVWKKYAVKIISYFITARNESIRGQEARLNKAADDVINFLNNITEIEKQENVTGPLINEIPEDMSVKDLQKLVDSETKKGVSKINWDKYFTNLYSGVPDVNLDIHGYDTVLVYKKPYFMMLSKYLDSVDENVLELSLWWNIVFTLASHINEEVADLKQMLSSKVLYDMSSQSRTSLCTETVYKLMTIAVSYDVTREEGVDKKKKKIHEMLSNIQKVFKDLITELNWMDANTKTKSAEKVDAIRKFVAFPEWMKNHTFLAEYYSNITIDESTHLANVISILHSGAIDQLKSLRTPHNSSIGNYEPLDINAYYNPSDNSITVPSGILQFPFYDLGLESLNYGAIGVILGHELTHGFDNNGRQFDRDGNLNQWWSPSSVEHYNNKTECYVNEYGNYYLPTINKTVNGNLTLGENLADNGGMREALLAYRRYVKQNGKEPKLPGLQSYTPEQLFYLAFGNIWCSVYTDESLEEALEDEHSPNFVRVIVTLQNLPYFSEAWNCPKGSRMNPENKCKLWTN